MFLGESCREACRENAHKEKHQGSMQTIQSGVSKPVTKTSRRYLLFQVSGDETDNPAHCWYCLRETLADHTDNDSGMRHQQKAGHSPNSSREIACFFLLKGSLTTSTENCCLDNVHGTEGIFQKDKFDFKSVAFGRGWTPT